MDNEFGGYIAASGSTHKETSAVISGIQFLRIRQHSRALKQTMRPELLYPVNIQ